MRFHRVRCQEDFAWPLPIRRSALRAASAFTLLAILTLVPGRLAHAQTEPVPASRSTTPAEDAAILNAVIEYASPAADSRAAAVAVFRQYPDNLTSLYYLGLYEMDQGITARNQAGKPEDPQHAKKTSDAQEHFKACRDYLRKLISIGQVQVDRAIQPVEAGIILATADLAQSVQGAEKPTPEIVALADEAIEILKKYVSLQENSDDYLAHFYLGVAYFRKSRYAQLLGDSGADRINRENSSREFDNAAARVAQLSAESEERLYVEAYVRYYGALSLFRADARQQGKDKLVDLLGFISQHSKLELADLQEEAESLVKKAEASREPASLKLGELDLRGYVSVGNAYDSNVAIPGERAELPRGIVRKGDYTLSLSAGAQLSYRFTKDRDKLAFGESLELGIRGDTSHAWHPSIQEFDLNSYRAGVFANWEPWRDFYAYADYTFTDTQLGREPFFGDHGALLGLRKIWSDAPEHSYGTALDFYYAYDNRTYYDVLTTHYLDRDGNYHEIGLRQSLDLIRADRLWSDYYQQKSGPEGDFDAKRWLNVYLGYDYRSESTQGSEFDLYSHEATAGVFVPLPWRLAFDYGVRLSWDNYASASLFDLRGNERFDFRHTHDLGLTYTIVERGELKEKGFETLRMRVRGFVGFVDQDSNVANSMRQAPYSYDRIQSGVVLEIGF